MNEQLFFLLNNVAGRYPWLDELMIATGVYLIWAVFLAAAILAGWALYLGRWRALFMFASVLVLAFGLVILVSIFYPGSRPFQQHVVTQLIPHEPGRSFVSHHAAAAFAIAAGAWLSFGKQLGIPFLLAAVLIGTARVYSGVHYPFDILGAAALALLATGLVRQLSPHQKTKGS